ncbi:GNAT family N-acetyltransferase [Aquiflexum sp.]|uniref:GNAT family N-acetyltransferase n=1 Tax=Aquiflexum sp. TaxID=1872584 RepID=UPI003594572E
MAPNARRLQLNHVGTTKKQTMYNSKISIRLSKITDLPELQKIFVGTISTICNEDYSPEQIKAWTSSIKNTQRWTDKLTSQYFLIAELDHKIVGFASLENNNYLDFLSVHKDHQRQGIADKLYSEIEKEAIKRGGTVLNSDVSETARKFFLKNGFKTLAPQTKIINDVEIINFKMAKQLNFNDRHYNTKKNAF